MLIGNDILQPKKIDILTSSSTARISSCGVTIPIELKAKGSRSITYPIHAVATMVMPPKSTAMIPVHSIKSLPSRRDLFFEPEDSGLSLYTHLIDSSLSSVLAKNDSENKVRIPRNLRLGHIFEADFNNYLHITSGVEDAADLATRTPRRQHYNNWIKHVFNKVVTTSAIAMLATSISGSVPNPPSVTAVTSVPEITVTPSAKDFTLPNGVTIYDDVPQLR